MPLNRDERLSLGQEAHVLAARLSFWAVEIADDQSEPAVTVATNLADIAEKTTILTQRYAAAVR